MDTPRAGDVRRLPLGAAPDRGRAAVNNPDYTCLNCRALTPDPPYRGCRNHERGLHAWILADGGDRPSFVVRPIIRGESETISYGRQKEPRVRRGPWRQRFVNWWASHASPHARGETWTRPTS